MWNAPYTFYISFKLCLFIQTEKASLSFKKRNNKMYFHFIENLILILLTQKSKCLCFFSQVHENSNIAFVSCVFSRKIFKNTTLCSSTNNWSVSDLYVGVRSLLRTVKHTAVRARVYAVLYAQVCAIVWVCYKYIKHRSTNKQ